MADIELTRRKRDLQVTNKVIDFPNKDKDEEFINVYVCDECEEPYWLAVFPDEEIWAYCNSCDSGYTLYEVLEDGQL